MVLRYVMMSVLAVLLVFVVSGCKEEITFTESTKEETVVSEVGLTSQTEEIAGIYVDVCGEVACPGVYCLPEGARVCDAILAAGGFTKDAVSDVVNQARILTDGEQLYVPSVEEYTRQEDTRININSATLEELCELPGVGEAKAQDILDYRQEHGNFLQIEDIMLIPGIKEGLFNQIKDKIKV